MSAPFPATLRRLREDRNLSQHALALACDFDHSYICRLEMGKRHPGIATVRRIAEVLELDQTDTAVLIISAGYWPGDNGAWLALSSWLTLPAVAQ